MTDGRKRKHHLPPYTAFYDEVRKEKEKNAQKIAKNYCKSGAAVVKYNGMYFNS